MESHKSSNAVYTPERRTPLRSVHQSPLPAHQQRLSFANESFSTAESPDTNKRKPVSKVESFRDVGVITSATSKYYLVRSRTNWVPVLKGNLLHPDQTPVDPHTDFSSLKFKKVRIVDPTSYSTLAILGDGEGPETARMGTNCDTERVGSPDLLTIRENNTRSSGLLEQYEELSIRLMTDVVALSRMVEGHCRGDNAMEFMLMEKGKIEKRVLAVVTELEQIDTPSAVEMKKVFLDLLHNLNDRVVATCENCHVAKYDVRLSCGHKYCAACQRKLVQQILNGAMVKCFLCRMQLTKVDKRVVALEMYYHRPRTACKSPHGADTQRGYKPKRGHVRTASQGTILTCSVCHRTVESRENTIPVSFCCSCCQCRSGWDDSLRPY